jgi:hypothetical protein
MKHANGIGRLAGLAVGMGIGAALAATPGVASADDFQISIDVMDLLPTAGNTATATSTMGDIAIAFGSGANATATGGFGDYALADGAGSTADVGSFGTSYLDAAIASGTNSLADGGYGYLDYASANGDSSIAGAGYGSGDVSIASGTDSGALTGGVTINNTTEVPGNDDFAYALGPHTVASADALVDPSNPTASSNDVATVFDPLGTMGSEAYAGGGNFDLAAIFGDGFNTDLGAVGGNFLTDILPML